MEATIKTADYELYLGDCLEIMPRLKSMSAHMIFSDLPYGTTELGWDSVPDLEGIFTNFRRIIKGYGAIVMTASQPFTNQLINAYPEGFRYNWVWEKSKVGDVMNAKNKPMKVHEDILIFSSGVCANNCDNRMPYYPQGLVKVDVTHHNKTSEQIKESHREAAFIGKRNRPEEYKQEYTNYPTSILKYPNDSDSINPTQKPLALLEYLIKSYTKPGEIVFDPTFGSAVACVACIRTGRKFVGIEKNPEQWEKSLKRIQGTSKNVQKSMFDYL